MSNHLSYLDILVYSSLSGCVFVAKKEVAGWPVLGVFAKMAGTIFVDRTRRMDVAGANERIGEALRAGVVVVVFPEATSSSGEAVLPFHSSLLQPAALCRYPLTPAAITYQLDGGSVANEVCYWRDMTLLPHLLNLFTKPGVRARVAFAAAAPAPELCSRKAHASHLHDSVSALLTSLRA